MPKQRGRDVALGMITHSGRREERSDFVANLAGARSGPVVAGDAQRIGRQAAHEHFDVGRRARDLTAVGTHHIDHAVFEIARPCARHVAALGRAGEVFGRLFAAEDGDQLVRRLGRDRECRGETHRGNFGVFYSMQAHL
jgi:hypothetical protein